MTQNSAVRTSLNQGEAWNAAWFARGAFGQTLVGATNTPSGTNATAAITSIGWAIYGMQADDSEVLLASQSQTPISTSDYTPLNPNGSSQVLSASAFNGFSPDANGHTVHVQVVPVASGAGWVAVAGESYRLEVELGTAIETGSSRVRLQSIAAIRPWFTAD